MIKFDKDFKFNILNIENYKSSKRMVFLKNFFKKNRKLKGDYFEFGVYQGRSLISVALLFKELGIKKKVYGFDSFGGFPNYSKFDNFENFFEMFKKKKISKKHYQDILNFKKIKNFLNKSNNSNQKLLPKNISSSNNFSDTSIKYLKKKINFLNLNNIILIKGDFNKTVTKFFKNNPDKKVLLANLDCDLYDSYTCALNEIWPKLVKKGIIYLDEYYSLKFPGAKIATDKFCREKKIFPNKIKTPKEDFERWYIKK